MSPLPWVVVHWVAPLALAAPVGSAAVVSILRLSNPNPMTAAAPAACQGATRSPTRGRR